MQVQTELGIKWDMLTLVGDEEKPPSLKGQHYYIFYMVRGSSALIIGDWY
jgi:hypothetical protein